jgi:hypothetical protein
MGNTLKEALKQLENKSLFSCEVYMISNELTELVCKEEQGNIDFLSEKLAFQFYEKNKDSSPYFYHPIFQNVGEIYDDARNREFSSVTKRTLAYWRERSSETPNLIFKIRYLGLVQELSEKMEGKRDYKSASEFVNVVLTFTNGILNQQEVKSSVFIGIKQKLYRAYLVAKSTNGRICDVAELAYKFELKFEDFEKLGTWGFCFEWFILSREKKLSDDLRDSIILGMEEKFSRCIQENYSVGAKETSKDLATHYRSEIQHNKKEEILVQYYDLLKRLFTQPDQSFFLSNQLEELKNTFYEFQLHDRYQEVLRHLQDLSGDTMKAMKSHQVKISLPIDKIDAEIDRYIDCPLDKAIWNYTIINIPKKEERQDQVEKQIAEFPFRHMIKNNLVNAHGTKFAEVGSAEDDFDGHLMLHYGKCFSFSHPFLVRVHEKIIDKFSLSGKKLVELLQESPIFSDDYISIQMILHGIERLLEKDYISATHVLIPKIEALLRKVVILLSEDILKKNSYGGEHYQTLDGLLRNPSITQCFSEDITYYFRAFLTDQRGLNVRNNVCHGFPYPLSFYEIIAHRLLHILFCIALVRDDEKSTIPV